MPREFRIRFVFAAALFVAILATATTVGADPATDASAMPSGAYQLDPNHTSITFKINHMGFSHYTGRFDKMEATLNFNPSAPDQSALDVTIYPNSIDTNNAKLEEELRGDKFFDVIKYPRATFQSTKIERTGPTTGKITGDFTFLGVTHSLTLDVTLIGAGKRIMDGAQVIGFSAVGLIHRSDYGFQNLIPMVGDDVTLEIESEFDKSL